jgi:hypothetical protein
MLLTPTQLRCFIRWPKPPRPSALRVGPARRRACREPRAGPTVSCAVPASAQARRPGSSTSGHGRMHGSRQMDASDGRPTIVEDARDGRFEGLGVSNSRFIQTWYRLATSPPLLQRGHPERTGYWLGAVPSDGLVEREVIEVAARDASVVSMSRNKTSVYQSALRMPSRTTLKPRSSAKRAVRSIKAVACPPTSSPAPRICRCITSWPTTATDRSGRDSRIAAATVDFPEPLLPRITFSRVDVDQVGPRDRSRLLPQTLQGMFVPAHSRCIRTSAERTQPGGSADRRHVAQPSPRACLQPRQRMAGGVWGGVIVGGVAGFRVGLSARR